jgi:SPP1 family predicted phage head-tail adaptor
MKAGALRWPITIQQRVPSQSSTTGEVTYTWTTFASVWADMAPVAKRGSRAAWEAVIAEQVKAQRVIQFVIRYIPGVNEQMRILDQSGLYWDIKSIINNDTRNRELWLIAEYGLNNG